MSLSLSLSLSISLSLYIYIYISIKQYSVSSTSARTRPAGEFHLLQKGYAKRGSHHQITKQSLLSRSKVTFSWNPLQRTRNYMYVHIYIYIHTYAYIYTSIHNYTYMPMFSTSIKQCIYIYISLLWDGENWSSLPGCRAA